MTSKAPRDPIARRPISVATVADTAIGNKAPRVHSANTTSMAKIMPVSGALKIAPMPPATPQASSSTRCRSARPMASDKVLPTAAAL